MLTHRLLTYLTFPAVLNIARCVMTRVYDACRSCLLLRIKLVSLLIRRVFTVLLCFFLQDKCDSCQELSVLDYEIVILLLEIRSSSFNLSNDFSGVEQSWLCVVACL